MPASVLAELRILTSTDFDSRSILTIVLCGDGRLTQQFRHEDLLPIASRIRARLLLDYLSPKELLEWLHHVLAQAGQAHLFTAEVMTTIAGHAAGNLRVLATMANELLLVAARREISQIDQKLYFEVFRRPTSSQGQSANHGRPKHQDLRPCPARPEPNMSNASLTSTEALPALPAAPAAPTAASPPIYDRQVPLEIVQAALLLAAARRSRRPSDVNSIAPSPRFTTSNP
jgi:hypothetical protein